MELSVLAPRASLFRGLAGPDGRRLAEATRLAPFVYGAAFFVFALAALPDYSFLNRTLAWAVFVAGTWPLVRLLFEPQRRVPILELALSNYVVLYALPVFFQDRLLTYRVDTGVQPPLVNEVLVYTLVAIVALRAGARLLSPQMWSKPWLVLRTDDRALARLGLAVTGGYLLLASGFLPIPAAFARPATVLFSSDLGLAALSVLYARGALFRWEKTASLAALIACCMVGLASGMSQNVLQPILVWGLAGWVARGRVPKGAIVAVVIGFFVLQPVKSQYRALVWYGEDGESSAIQSVGLFGSLVYEYWVGQVAGGEVGLGDDVKESAASRLSYLLPTMWVFNLTPEVYEFTGGESLYYMLYFWIPRFVWPEKPQGMVANKIYPVRYGFQHPATLETSTYGMGHVSEVYINVGLMLSPIIFFVIGIFYAIPYRVLGQGGGDAGRLAILVAAAVGGMFVGSTVSASLGILAQQVITQALIVKWLAYSRIRHL